MGKFEDASAEFVSVDNVKVRTLRRWFKESREIQ